MTWEQRWRARRGNKPPFLSTVEFATAAAAVLKRRPGGMRISELDQTQQLFYEKRALGAKGAIDCYSVRNILGLFG